MFLEREKLDRELEACFMRFAGHWLAVSREAAKRSRDEMILTHEEPVLGPNAIAKDLIAAKATVSKLRDQNRNLSAELHDAKEVVCVQVSCLTLGHFELPQPQPHQ